MPPKRVVLFIDYQNVYRRARAAFWADNAPNHWDGQVDPLALGKHLAALGADRVLHEVRVHLGCPSSSKDPKSYAPHRRQVAAWEAAGCKVFPRPLRYPVNYPKERPQEKGIDVALAIDFISLATDGEYDVGILASVDTDLKPALEFVHRRFAERCQIEVMAWAGTSRLSIPGQNIWCHWLDRAAYQKVADPTDYNR